MKSRLSSYSTRLVLAGALVAFAMPAQSLWAEVPAVVEARKLLDSKPSQAVKQLRDAFTQATDAASQAEVRLALVDAFLAHGRPIEAAAEAEAWLRIDPKSPQREAVMLKLIAAQKQAGDWDAAAGNCRTFSREFKASANRPAVLESLVAIARFGQQTFSGEASALADLIEASPESPLVLDRMLRMAKLQEQVGDVSGAVGTLKRVVARFPGSPAADEAGWRAAFITQDRARNSADALAMGSEHLKAFPNRATAARDWQWLGDVARSMESYPKAIAAYREVLKRDPANRDAASWSLDCAIRMNSESEVSQVSDWIQNSLKGDTLVVESRLQLLRLQLASPKANPAAVRDQVLAILKAGSQSSLAIDIAEQSIGRAAGANARAQLDEFFKAGIAQAAAPRFKSELALRYAASLRSQGRLDAARDVLLADLKGNPVNRREVARDLVMAIVDFQRQEMNAGKRRKYEFEAPFRQVIETVEPVAYLPEIRIGLDDAVGQIARAQLKDASHQLRLQVDELAKSELAALVDTVNREARRDKGRALESLMLLNKRAKELPGIHDVLGFSAWAMLDRLPQNQRDDIAPWFVAWAAAQPTDVVLQRDVGEMLRRIGQSEAAAMCLRRVLEVPVTPQNAGQVGQALGALVDLEAYARKDYKAVDALAEKIEGLGAQLPVASRQELGRRLAEVAASRGQKDVQAQYLRKVIKLAMNDAGYDAVRKLMQLLPAKQAAEEGKALLAMPSADRWYPQLALVVANRLALGSGDLLGAMELVQEASRRRDTGFRADDDELSTLRDLCQLALDVAEPVRVSDPARRAQLKEIKPPTPAQVDQLLYTAHRWLSSQQLQEVTREIVRREGARKNAAAQLGAFVQTLSRTRANDAWHWGANLDIAREEAGRQNDGVASTMLRLMLKANPQLAEDSRRAARNLLIASFARFGEDLLAVDEKSPVAALLKAASYLRLGEEKQAWAIYQANSALFAQRIDEVPAEYVLFVGSELAMGNDADRDVAEQLLRTWLARADKITGLEPATRAAVMLKLADVFYYGRRFDVARAEYQGLIDKYPDLAQATEAQFRIGETFMYQKNYAEAAKVFDRLRKSKDQDTVIRSIFMKGVLLYTQGGREEARETFKSLLDLAPPEELASKTLYQLALIYGDDNRFREMLDMLETIGRLGREGKRWHTPGQTLTVMIHDPDLSIVQEATMVPVVVSTTGGDREQVNMIAGSAGRGIFIAEIPTALGSPKPGDGTLQVLGNDVISYDYPEDFKSRFKYVPPPQGNIRIASDATFAAQATKIVEEEKTTLVDKAQKEAKIVRDTDAPREFRNNREIKPGNPVYVKVGDGDRSITTGVDRVEVVLRAASGDAVRAFINETGPDSGTFEGMVNTAERPPEAIASDSALGRPAAMAGDKDPASAWESQHDGVQNKWIAADLKDIHRVESLRVGFPDAKLHKPTKWVLETSLNGQLWEPAYSTTKGSIAHGLALSYGPMQVVRYPWSTVKTAVGMTRVPSDVAGYVALLKNPKLPAAEPIAMDSLAIPEFTRDPEADVLLVSGYLNVSATGAHVFHLRGGKNNDAILVIDGKVVANGRNAWAEGTPVDLSAGWHRLAVLCNSSAKVDKNEKPTAPEVWYSAPGGRGVASQALAAGGKQAMPAPAVYAVPEEPQVKVEPQSIEATLPGISARFVRLGIQAYEGDYVSVSDFTVRGDTDKTLLPTDADLVRLSDDDVLQVSPGDDVTITYADQVNTRTPGEARILSSKLKATYFNASVRALVYDVKSGAAGVTRTERDVYRIDPGDRVIASITDYDEDRTPQVDKVSFVARTQSGQELVLEATETIGTSGVFRKEIDTTAGSEPGKLTVKPGETVFLIYKDRLNTVPGSQVDRTTTVEVVKPTDGQMAILPTRTDRSKMVAPKVDKNDKGASPKATLGQPTIIYLAPEKEGKIARVVLAAPLTIEVYDPDCAKDAHSTIKVDLATSAGAKLTVPLEISGGAMPAGSAKTSKSGGTGPGDVGRFVGQVLLVLGKPDENGKFTTNVSLERAGGLIGAWRYEKSDDEGAVAAPILPITGADTITATYTDQRNPLGKDRVMTSSAKMVTDGLVENLDRTYENKVDRLHLGQKLFLRLEDADRDLTAQRETITADLVTAQGGKLTVNFTETLGHSGVFTAEVPTAFAEKPVPTTGPSVATTFGDVLTLTYDDETNSESVSTVKRTLEVAISPGADANLAAFTKQFGTEDMAVETLFKLAECHFELFKNHNALSQAAEARQSLEAGRSILAEVRQNYRNPKYEARVLFLLGSYHQELKEFDEAMEQFRTIVRSYSNSNLAPDAQYKLGQCYEDKGEMDQACEEYVRLAYTYPDNPLIAKCMVRLAEYFYKSGKYLVAADISARFLEQYGEHEWAAKIAFRKGQCYFRAGEAAAKEAGVKPAAKGAGVGADLFIKAAKSFDLIVERYPDSDLKADALFWAGHSYHQGGDAIFAYRRYRRCTWDYPDSEAARLARGRLTLPEIQAASKADEKGN